MFLYVAVRIDSIIQRVQMTTQPSTSPHAPELLVLDEEDALVCENNFADAIAELDGHGSAHPAAPASASLGPQTSFTDPRQVSPSQPLRKRSKPSTAGSADEGVNSGAGAEAEPVLLAPIRIAGPSRPGKRHTTTLLFSR